MPVGDVLKNFRATDYGKDPGAAPDPGSSDPKAPEGPRSIKLTDEEAKDLQNYGEPGTEQQCLVTGRLDDKGEFTVISVQGQGGPGPGDENDMAAQVMGKMGMPPTVQQQTMPSPS